jgi:L-alanine-DL-glutamate epimerase-like enolase superfamily enzyme
MRYDPLSMTTIVRAEASLLRYRLETPVGGSGVSAVDVLLVTLTGSEGAEGLGFGYILGGAAGEAVLAVTRAQLDAHVVQKPRVPPQALWRRIASSFNRTGLGLNHVALAAIDLAAWDLDARARNVSLAVTLGGAARPVPVYGSGGFTAGQDPVEAAATAASHARRGLHAVKPRVRGERRDLAVIDAVRDAVPPHVQVMLDANERCDPATARWLLAAARDRGVLFVEEPLPAAALDGYRALAASGGAALAAGEHLQGRAAFLPFLSERLVSVIQPDLAMTGGLTPILEIAALADAFGIGVSPHFLPGLFVHVAAACPAVTWLEEFPLLEPLFDGWPLVASDGTMSPTSAPGHGLTVRAA